MDTDRPLPGGGQRMRVDRVGFSIFLGCVAWALSAAACPAGERLPDCLEGTDLEARSVGGDDRFAVAAVTGKGELLQIVPAGVILPPHWAGWPVPAGRALRLTDVGEKTDRYGRLPAQVHVEDGDGRWGWLQGDLLAEGRVLAEASDGRCGEALLAAEAKGRDRGVGLWQYGGVVRATDDRLLDHVSDYVVVRGRPLSVGMSGRRIYLNFGHDWATDLTITLSEDLARQWIDRQGAAADRDDSDLREGLQQMLAGRWIEARGWLQERGGPAIELEAAAALRLLRCGVGNTISCP
ncbi:hypothetical protein HDIA_4322 [Hartmannibacter diazotrophicus]|uniref:TNase-like domain-containing protein n=1 Tax=Hartmannibacter diazotrophicus TaxID=1482074 RepID=A0A2C9DC96_9HYPH|nr:hypothetical protein [Hartmannibacter diazotrophicus]SON57863.1 hypothetical protein HDIA_4322 [Hartmannibacter diazotrophicus]